MGFIKAIGNAICCSSCCRRPHHEFRKKDDRQERTDLASQRALQAADLGRTPSTDGVGLKQRRVTREESGSPTHERTESPPSQRSGGGVDATHEE